jgi:hypothetical protein
MRRQRVFLGAALILLVGIASAVAFALVAPEERAPESLLPGDSAIYLGFDGTEKHKAEWENTAFYESLDKTHFLSTLTDLALSYLPEDAAIKRQDVRQLLEAICRRGVSVAVGFPKGHTVPRVVVVLHQASALAARLNEFAPQFASAERKAETLILRGRRVTRATFPSIGAELAWWLDGGNLVLVFGEGAIDAALDVADGKTPALPSTANWRKFREEPKDFRAIAAAWCDVAALRARYGDQELQKRTDTQPAFTVAQLIDVLGADRMRCLAWRCGLKGRAIVSEATIEAPTPRTGIMALADQAPISLVDLPPFPKESAGFAAVSFDWNKVYGRALDTAHHIADTVALNGSAKVDETMQRVTAVLGFDLKTDLFDNLGHVACIYGDPRSGIPGIGFGIALSVEKPDALQKTLKIALEKLQAAFPNGVTFAEEERLGRPVWVFDLGQIPFHPAAAFDKHWLFLGLSPQAIQSALMRVDGKLDGWKPSEADQAALDCVPKQFIALSLADPRPFYEGVVTALPFLVTGLNQAAGPGNPPGDGAGKRMAILADIPPAEILTRPMFPNVGALTVDAKGVRWQSRESAPALTASAFVGGPVAIALLLPAVQAAREAARRTESKNHLKQLALAMHNYHSANGSFPAGTHSNPQLKPDKRLSWLVDLLPYLEFRPIYDEMDLKKAWDDPANRKDVELPLALFMNPSVGPPKDNVHAVTEYVGMAGLGADGPTLPVTSPRAGVFAYDRVTRIEDIIDGTSNTIMISECDKDLGPWAAGGDATIRSLTKKPYIDGPDGLGGQHEGGCQVALADGSVRFVSRDIDPTLLEHLMTIAGHEQAALPRP